MTEQDPLKQNRLGLRGVLLVSSGVLVTTSVFLLPNVGLLQGAAPTTSLSVPPGAAGTTGGPDVPGAPGDRTAAEGDGSGAAADATGQGGDASSPTGPPPDLLPVYWLGDVDGSDRLFREFVTGTDPAPVDPIAEAVRLMTAGQPLDPDYHSPWRPASEVSSSISTQNVITLDLAPDVFGGSLPEDKARLAIQQLVYTATAAAAEAGLIAGGESSSVVVLVDGAAGYRAFDAVDLDGEWIRDGAVLSPVWIIDPQQDTETDGALLVHGLAPADATAVRWRLDSRGNDSVPGESAGTSTSRYGSAPVERGETAVGTYSFSEPVPAGRYDITVSVTADGVTAEDTKSVVVR